ncbi:hypothetical protein GCM10010228_79810 [Streptomyces massasporeus]|nr:hypothetical protein GCM10010228_79810 [Streptomyces massasporeus]
MGRGVLAQVHWPYVSAVDQALTDRGIPPGIVRAGIALRPYYETDRRAAISGLLVWAVSSTGTRGGVRTSWDDETGWSYAKLGPHAQDVLLEAPVTSLRRVLPPRTTSASTQRSGTGHRRCGSRSRRSTSTGARRRADRLSLQRYATPRFPHGYRRPRPPPAAARPVSGPAVR